MRFKKLRPAREVENIDENYSSPLIAPGEEVVRESSGRDTAASLALTFGGGLKFILGVLVFGLLILIALYTFLSASLMFAAPSPTSDTERIWVARGTFEGGQVDPGTTVYGSSSGPASQGFLDKIAEGYVGAQDHYIVDTLIGPLGDLESRDGSVYLNGQPTDVKGDIEPIRLSDQYLAECVSGDLCEPGDLVVVDRDSIAGEVRGILSFDGLRDAHDEESAEEPVPNGDGGADSDGK